MGNSSCRPWPLYPKLLVPTLILVQILLTGLSVFFLANKPHLGITEDFQFIRDLFIVLIATFRFEYRTHVSTRCLF